MNANQVAGVVRTVVPAALAYVVAKGWVTQDMVADITTAIVTLVLAGWSIYSNIEKKQ